jgi:hypothetical protein
MSKRRSAINATVDRINLIWWDDRRQGARLTLPREEMIQLAEDLMESGAGMVRSGRGIADADDPWRARRCGASTPATPEPSLEP